MNHSQLTDLLDYHYWAQERLLAAVEKLSPADYMRDMGSSFPSIHDTLVHTYSAEWIWCSRWTGEWPTEMLDSSTFADLATLRTAWEDHETRMRSVLDTFGQKGLDQFVEYRDTKGTAWRQRFWEMLQHVVNHASYHRGQVVTMLRQLKAEPPEGMDLISYHRERASD